MKRLGTLLFLSAVLLCGCFLADQKFSEDDMLRLTDSLTKLTSAVESTVRYKSPDPDLKDRALIDFSIQHDPVLAQDFQIYTLKAKGENRHALVLVCSEDGSEALIEDAGCTMVPDKRHWEDTSPKPCEFTIDLNELCGQ